uniref:Abhydrolase domain containing 16A, phospholipase n=1 Tax=Gadus morhua TaxID=8049 RepID=A0A8C4ZNK9_GADMO
MAGWMWLRIFFGPNLQRIHSSPGQSRPEIYLHSPSISQGWNYQPLRLEKHTDSVIGWASVLWSLSYYSSPLLLCYLYKKGEFGLVKFVPVSQYVGTVLICLLGVVCLRGWGRWKNSEYVQFFSILEETRKNNTPSNKVRLEPLFFFPLSKAGVSLLKPESRLRGAADGVLQQVRTLPCHVISFLIAHSFGRRMLYPGSVGLLQKFMRPMLQQGQAKLIEEFNGQRNKLVACDGNEIDTMFVDRRADGRPGGSTLVICCEGNAGFYEVGCMNTPLEGGYSVLGWNHPGFGDSTGVPFPQNEANAMDVVIQFAMQKLGFQLNDIIIYAWSIGGFTASWAVMSYPELKAVVLDASFDDLLPLALKVMPASWRLRASPCGEQCLTRYFSPRYPGPVLLIRRTKDEIITTAGPEDIMSNRGNDLLLKLLQFRYPKVMADEGVRVVREWLGASNTIAEATVYSQYEVDDDWCVTVLQSYRTHNGTAFPWSVGEDMTLECRRRLALFLARKYMRNFETTHCTPLPFSEFRAPWTL